MRLTPNDIVNKQFSRSRTGYSAAEVDDFVREVAHEFELALADSAKLQERLEVLERELERFEAMETTLKEALILAQSTANETRALAMRESDVILSDARARADEMRRDAVWQFEKLRQERLRFGWEFRAMLQSQLDHLDAELERTNHPAAVEDDNDTDIVNPPAETTPSRSRGKHAPARLPAEPMPAISPQPHGSD